MNHTALQIDGAGVTLAADRWEVPAGQPVRGALVLLHGGGQTRHSWHTSAPAFAARGWSTLTVDARGHGDSGWASDGNYSLDAMVADLHAIAATLDTPPVLVGASMGGMTAMVAQGESPELARSLVLVDIAPKTEPAGVKRITDFMHAGRDGFASLEAVAEAVRAYNPHRKRSGSLEGLKKNVRLRADGRWYWHWDPAFLDYGDEAKRQASSARLYAAAANITVPTLLIRGKNSDVVTEEGAAELRELIPGAQVAEAAAGHMVAGDDNDVFSTQVIDFLDLAV